MESGHLGYFGPIGYFFSHNKIFKKNPSSFDPIFPQFLHLNEGPFGGGDSLTKQRATWLTVGSRVGGAELHWILGEISTGFQVNNY